MAIKVNFPRDQAVSVFTAGAELPVVFNTLKSATTSWFTPVRLLSCHPASVMWIGG